MPIASRSAQALAAACLVVVTWLSVTPAPAAALDPPRPLPGYRPAFVTETDTRPWNDCLWASGAMLIDRWTNGATTISHGALRKLAREEGSSALPDLQRAYARLGVGLVFSPNGGARITWGQLLRRLETGAGAVLLGDDSKLPRWYGRWDYSFWKATDKGDDHAVYIERYDRKRGRVWLMDPLGRGDWHGEWISVRALRTYAWRTAGGALYVAVTPTAKAAPYQGVAVGKPAAVLTATSLDVSWDVSTPHGWAFPGADVTANYAPADDPLLSAAVAPAPLSASAMATVDAPPEPAATVVAGSLRATASLPTTPGAWVATIAVTDRRFGREVARSDAATIFIPGPRRAALRLRVLDDQVEAGGSLPIAVSVANTGEISWADPPTLIGVPPERTAIRTTRVIARWIPLDIPAGDPEAGGADAAVAEALAAPDPVLVGEVPFAPGRRADLSANLAVPVTGGHWALAIDVVDDVDGSFAAGGSAPAVVVLDVAPTAGIAAIR